MTRPTPCGHAVAAHDQFDTWKGVFPGHIDPLDEMARPGVGMVMVKGTWRDFEPEKGKHSLNFPRAVLDRCAALGVKVAFQIRHRGFGDKDIVCPDWLGPVWYEGAKNSGWQADIWSQDTMRRLTDVHHAFHSTFGSHPAFIGTATEETATGLRSGEHGYDPYAYVDLLREQGRTICREHRDTRLFCYLNFIEGWQSALIPLALDLSAHGSAIGNPDILPGNAALESGIYAAFDELSDAYTFSCAQPDTFRKHEPQEVIDFAQERHLNLVIWNWEPYASATTRTIHGALPLIAQSTLQAPPPQVVYRTPPEVVGHLMAEREALCAEIAPARDRIAALDELLGVARG